MEAAVQIAQEFFDRYAASLLARDAPQIATMYAVPSLILFPEQSVPVSDASQTEQFFDSVMGQYEGVEDATPALSVLASTGHSIWVDVTWSYDGQPSERFVYQLVHREGWQIAVLSPLELDR